MAHDVFLSYASEDKPIADAVCATLEGKAIRCWIAPRDVLPGMDWGEAIVDALVASKLLVLVYSGSSNQSMHVRREVERAVRQGLTIVPFRIEKVEISKPLDFFIGNLHWLDALTPPMERHIESLAETIDLLIRRMDTDTEELLPRVERLPAPEPAPEPEAVGPGAGPIGPAPTAVVEEPAVPRAPEPEAVATTERATEQEAAATGVAADPSAGPATSAVAIPPPRWWESPAARLGLATAAAIAAVAVIWAVVRALTSAPSTSCVPSARGGCPAQLGQTLTGTLSSSSPRHTWYVEVPSGTDFRFELKGDQATDYDLDVRGPGGFSVGSHNSRGSDDLVQVPSATGGEYISEVTNFGDPGRSSYRLALLPGVLVLTSTPIPVTPTPQVSLVPTRSASSFFDDLFGTPTPNPAPTPDRGTSCSSQPDPGRVLPLGLTAVEVAGDSGDSWRLTLPNSGTLSVVLSEMSIDLDLWVLTPSGDCWWSYKSSLEPDTVTLRNAASGDYVIRVARTLGPSLGRYSLRATVSP